MPDPSKPWWKLTLIEADKVLHYGAECPKCKETRHIDLARLAEILGSDYTLEQLAPRLSCNRCGTRKGVIKCVHWKRATTTDQAIASWKRY